MNTPIFSSFPNAAATQGTSTDLPAVIGAIRSGVWSARVAAIRQAIANGGKQAAQPLKRLLPGFAFAGQFSRRRASGLLAPSGLICADLDSLGDRLTQVRAALLGDARTVALFTSPSGDGLKVVFRCDPTRPHVQSFYAAREHVQSVTGEAIDEACKDVARLCFASHDPEAYLVADVEAVPVLAYSLAATADGAGIGSLVGFDQTEESETEQEATPELVALARAHLAALPPAISGHGGHDATFRAALALAWGFGFGDADALPLFQEFNARCVPPWTESELLHKLDGARQDAAGKPPFKYLVPATVVPGEPLKACDHATDVDASIRFAEAQAEVLRYAPGIGWLFWDGTRWAEDTVGRALELSKQSARKWTLRASAANAEPEVRSRMVKAALALEGASHVRAAVELAKSDPRLVINPERLDADPYLLNVLNGTLDLRTGELRPHRREDFITKLAPVEYLPEATHPAVDRYLLRLRASEPEMPEFLARCFGAALTGDASPESLFLLQGDGGSGKTTLVEAFASLLGGYSVKLAFDSFVLSRGRSPGAASPDLVKLRGARLAYASEGDQSARLDAGVVKILTGNEPVTARALYRDPLTFYPTWKLWLVSNFDPRADSDDTGIWRRMAKLHFEAVPEDQRDPTVKKALTSDPAARSALLAWALAGCLDWQARGGGRIGLAPPASVRAQTEAYRQKQDALGEWWDDLLATEAELKEDGTITASEIRRNYDEWTRENGARPVNAKRFAAYLASKGLEAGRASGGSRTRLWRGIQRVPFCAAPAIGFVPTASGTQGTAHA